MAAPAVGTIHAPLSREQEVNPQGGCYYHAVRLDAMASAHSIRRRGMIRAMTERLPWEAKERMPVSFPGTPVVVTLD